MTAMLAKVVDNLDFDLELRGGLSGVVRDDNGDPMPGAFIHAWDDQGAAMVVDVTELEQRITPYI